MSTTEPIRNRDVVVQNFHTEVDAENAIRALLDAGFTPDQISVVAHDKDRSQVVVDETEEEVATGAGIGAVTGGVLGGIIGLLVEAAALAIPGIGIVIAGPLAAALGGAGVGAITGGIAGALAALGVTEDEAQRNQEHFEAGDILVIVDAGDRAREAREILETGGTLDTPLT